MHNEHGQLYILTSWFISCCRTHWWLLALLVTTKIISQLVTMMVVEQEKGPIHLERPIDCYLLMKKPSHRFLAA
jgi:hypothetical protein